MPSIKLVNHLLLGSVTFSVSLIMGLAVTQNWQKALQIGAIATPGGYAAGAIVAKRRLQQDKKTRNSLYHQIQNLEKKENQLYQTLASASAFNQELEASISSLQLERRQLRCRISELCYQQNQLYQKIGSLQQQHQQQKEEFISQKTRVQQLEKRQVELNHSISLQTIKIQPTQNRLKTLRYQCQKIQQQIVDKQKQQAELNYVLATLESKKRHLEAEIEDLRRQNKCIQLGQEKLNTSILSLRIQKQEIEASLSNSQEQLQQLKNQLKILSEQRANFSFDADRNLARLLPREWLEWLNFYEQLSEENKIILKAILNSDEATLKQLAAEKATLIEALIESLNTTAINAMGETIFVSSNKSVIPDLDEEYTKILQEPTFVYLKDLLEREE